ncbi:MAG: M28 family peptidase [Candidatus Thorarchaeota archaeon]
MQRNRMAAILIIIIVASGSLLVYFMNQTPPAEPPDETQRIFKPHRYNQLNWWELPSEIIDEANFNRVFERMPTFIGRWKVADNYYAAGDFLIEEFDRYGVPATYFGAHDSVVGFQEGYGNDSRAIVFGAHLDSYPSSSGLNTNGGGVAVVAGLASVLSQYRLPIDIYYCFFQGRLESLGGRGEIFLMWGSNEISDYFVEEDIDVIAFYNFERLLYVAPNQPEQQRLIVEHHNVDSWGYHSSEYLADLLYLFMRQTGMDIMTIVEDPSTQTDTWPFWDEGFPAINVIGGHVYDQEVYPWTDTISNPYCNRTQILHLVKAAAAVAVFLGMRGNSKVISQKFFRKIAPGAQVSMETIISLPQNLTLHVTLPVNSSIEVSITGTPPILLPPTSLEGGNFSITTETPAQIGPVTVTVLNNGSETLDLKLILEYMTDTDGNSVPDSLQYLWPDPDPPLDWDGDGLSDVDETLVGTDIFVRDTDHDDMSDFAEVSTGLDPLRKNRNEDPDEDGVPNFREIKLGILPLNNDSDADGMDDGWEVLYGTKPGVNSSANDYDGDNLTNIEEYLYGSHPRKVDGDYDGIDDVDEIELGTNPLSSDSDDDGLSDLLEVQEGLNPLVPDFDVDLEPDGLDHNPRINSLLMIFLFSAAPIGIGSFIFWRRVR